MTIVPTSQFNVQSNSAFTLAVGHGTAQHGTLNFASVNGYRSEPNRYILQPCWLGTARHSRQIETNLAISLAAVRKYDGFYHGQT